MVLNRKKMNKYVLYFIIIFNLFSGLIGFRTIWHISILTLYLLVIFVNSKKIYAKQKSNYLILALVVISCLLFLFSLLISNSYNATFVNVRSSLYSLCGIGILYVLNKADNEGICNLIFKNIKFFNIVLIINMIVLVPQIMGTGFLIRKTWLEENPFYIDHCAGLFGANSTNILGTYSIFVLMLNLAYVTRYKTRSKLIVVITLITQGIMAFLSQYNDNTGFYFFLFLALAFYAYSTISRDADLSRKIVKSMKYFVIIVIILVCILQMPVLGPYIKKIVFDKVNRFFFYDSYGGASGGSERLAIVRFAFGLKSTWKFGTGVGATEWIQHAFGFNHFGINSIGSYITIGGFWFYLFYTILYSEIYHSLFGVKKGKKKFLYKIITFVTVVILTIYTSIYNDPRTAILVGMIAVVAGPLLERNKVKDVPLCYKEKNR